MNIKQLQGKGKWVASVAILAVALISGYLLITQTEIFAQDSAQLATTGANAELPTVAVQPADAVLSAVSASGNLELVSRRHVALAVDGVVGEIAVSAGDEVTAGQALLTLDSTELERAVKRAELAVQADQNTLEQLSEAADDADIAAAQAALVEAQENLADVQAGPDAGEVTAARSSLSAAWSAYNELLAGASEAELTQLSAELRKAEVAVAQAQDAYNAIAWQNSAGMTSQAADLQSATIDYESAKAAYTESTAPADASSIQSALTTAQNAQVTLDALLNSPSAAEIASAGAQVAQAQATLDALLAGATESEWRAANISLEQSLVDLEEAYSDLAAATVTAPIDGMVLSVSVDTGERVSSGAVAVTLADATQLELTISVAEVDIAHVAVGQQATIEIDALAGQTFPGVVEQIAPTDDSSSGTVSYPVTIRLTSEGLESVLPGMSAVATLTSDTASLGGQLLVPTNGIGEQDGTLIVMVVRDGATVAVEVVPGIVQGEYTAVQSSGLQVGDHVLGSVTSSSGDSGMQGPPGGMPPMDAGMGQ